MDVCPGRWTSGPSRWRGGVGQPAPAPPPRRRRARHIIERPCGLRWPQVCGECRCENLVRGPSTRCRSILRTRRGWRQADLARAAAMSRGPVSLLERGILEGVMIGSFRRLAATLDLRLRTSSRAGVVAKWIGCSGDAIRCGTRHSRTPPRSARLDVPARGVLLRLRRTRGHRHARLARGASDGAGRGVQDSVGGRQRT